MTDTTGPTETRWRAHPQKAAPTHAAWLGLVSAADGLHAEGSHNVRPALLSVVGALALLTHNDSIAFVAASALLVGSVRTQQPYRAVVASLVALFPLLVWLFMRQVLGQNGSHPMGFGVGRYDPVRYLVQLVRGAGSLIVPDRLGAPFLAVAVGLVLIVVMVRQRHSSRPLQFGALFAGLSAAFGCSPTARLLLDGYLGPHQYKCDT